MRRLLVAVLVISAPQLCAYNVLTSAAGQPAHWATRNIQYWINLAGSGLSSDQTLAAIQSAFQSWEQTGVGLTFLFMGFTSAQNSIADSKNVIFWSSDRSIIAEGRYARTIPNIDQGTGEIRDMDIVFNQRTGFSVTESAICGGFTAFNPFGIPLVWNLTDQHLQFGLFPGTDSYRTQVQATATHEIGHLLGLAHTPVVGATMSIQDVTPEIWCTTTQAFLKADDIAGIKFLYAPSQITYNFTTFDVPGSNATIAQGINNAGSVVGYYNSTGNLSSTLWRGFVRKLDGGITTFDAPMTAPPSQPPAPGTFAYAINNADQVLSNNAYAYAFSRSADGLRYTPIPDPGFSTARGTYPFGTNDLGQIVGFSGFLFFYIGNGFVDSSTGVASVVSLPLAGFSSAVPHGINNAGDIVGFWNGSNGSQHGFIRTASGALTSLDGPPPSPSGYLFVLGINNLGQTVGQSCNLICHGFVRDFTGTMVQLDVPGGENTFAFGINDSGQITGYYRTPGSGVAHSFLATPQ